MKSAEEILREHISVCRNFPDPTCSGCLCDRDLAAIRAAQIDAAEGMRERAALIARDAWMVPPDGGSPSKGETDVCDRAEAAIRAIKLPGDGE